MTEAAPESTEIDWMKIGRISVALDTGTWFFERPAKSYEQGSRQ